jgi:hypothetical protein
MSSLERNSSNWEELPPTLSGKFEMSNDLLTLVVYNLKENKGFSINTGRPFVLAARLMSRIVTGIRAKDMNEALNNLYKGGTCVVERIDGQKDDRPGTNIYVNFMFYLTYEGEPDVMTDEPVEVDPKLAVHWDNYFADFESARIKKPGYVAPSPVASKPAPFSLNDF